MKGAGRRGRRLRGLMLWLVLAAVSVVAIAVAAETLRIDSTWSAEAPAVDGKLTEWPSPLVTLGQTKLSLGVRNDGQNLYVAFASSDQGTRVMLGAAGFTVWVDPSGKDKKMFGVTVPPIMTGPGMRGRGEGGFPGQGGQPADWQGAQSVRAITSIEVVGPSKDDKRRLELTYARTIGLDVVARLSEGVLVYELRVPLIVSESQPYGAKSVPGATIGLGIESNQMPRPEGREGRGGPNSRLEGAPPSGGGGGRGGMGGGMGGGGAQTGGMGGGPPEGGRGEMRELKPIKSWAVVRLATPPA